MGTDKCCDGSKGLRAKERLGGSLATLGNEKFTVIIKAERDEWTFNREQAGWAPLFLVLPVA